MKLFIDSRDNLKTIIKIDGESFVIRYNSPRDQDVLGSVKRALDEKKLKWEAIDEIGVATGKGSFTGIRVGMAVGQALGFELGIKVNSQEVLEQGEVDYGAEPNIIL